MPKARECGKIERSSRALAQLRDPSSRATHLGFRKSRKSVVKFRDLLSILWPLAFLKRCGRRVTNFINSRSDLPARMESSMIPLLEGEDQCTNLSMTTIAAGNGRSADAGHPDGAVCVPGSSRPKRECNSFYSTRSQKSYCTQGRKRLLTDEQLGCHPDCRAIRKLEEQATSNCQLLSDHNDLRRQLDASQEIVRKLRFQRNSLGVKLQHRGNEILFLNQTIRELSSAEDELQKIAHEHESCVKIAHDQHDEICGSYASESATPPQIHEALFATRAAVTKFQKHLAKDLKGLASIKDLLKQGAFFARPDHLKYSLKANIYEALFQGFENESFQTSSGVSKFLDPNLRQAKFFEYYRHAKEDDSYRPEDPQYEEFLTEKIFTVCETLDLIFDSDSSDKIVHKVLGVELTKSFVAAATSVWLLQKLAFSFEPPASIFRVEPGADLDLDYMVSVVNLEDSDKFVPKVGFMMSPGLRLRKTVLPCEVYLAGQTTTELITTEETATG